MNINDIIYLSFTTLPLLQFEQKTLFWGMMSVCDA